MKNFLIRFFTWWNGATIGTRLFTRRYGEKVGTDEFGNDYYQTGDGKRRWVIYNGYSEASAITADWHGWMHHTWDEPPTARPMQRRPWQIPHKPTVTGTPEAYHPPGSLLTPESRPRVSGDYDAWQPE